MIEEKTMKTKRDSIAVVAVITVTLVLGHVCVAQGQVVKDGLLSFWSFDGISLPDVPDDFGDRDGTLIGSANVVAGRFGQALEFSGDGFVEFDPTGLPEGDAPRTMAVWVHTGSGGGLKAPIEYGNGTSVGQRFSILIEGLAINFIGENADIWTSTEVASNEWSYVAVTYDGDTVRMYLDGEFFQEGMRSLDTEIVEGFGRIGSNVRSHGNFEEAWDGMVDDVAIYDRALSDSEILNHRRSIPEPGNEQGPQQLPHDP